jgi:flagellar motor component MotA
MDIKTIFQNIRNLFKPQKEEELQDEVIVKFMRILEDVRAEEMSCDEMFNRLDEFVETEVESHDAEKLMPLVREHLDMCSECEEEYEALLDVLEHTK